MKSGHEESTLFYINFGLSIRVDIDTVVWTMDMGWRVGYQRQGSSYCYLVPLPCQYSPGHRIQSIRSCRNYCQDLYCQDDQSEACVQIMWSVLTNKWPLSGSLMPAMSNNCLQFWESFHFSIGQRLHLGLCMFLRIPFCFAEICLPVFLAG